MAEIPFHGILATYNARGLGPREIAATFVPPRQFGILSQRSHSVLLGPRGSGKTTLLRMLEPASLELWNNSQADWFREHIDFTGVFVSADPNWNSQRESVGWRDIADPHRAMLSSASFCTHILRAIVDAFIFRLSAPPVDVGASFRRVTRVDVDEAKLVRQLNDLWRTTAPIASLEGLRHALRRRLIDIREFAAREDELGEVGRSARVDAAGFLYVDMLSAATTAFEAFDELTRQPTGSARWALLFDELELAPTSIRRSLFGTLRSSSREVLLKLAISPYSEDFSLMDEAQGAKEGQDFDEIPLWYSQKEESYQFCEDLWKAHARGKGDVPPTPSDFLGQSLLEQQRSDARESKRGYRRGGIVQRSFVSLAERDPSFSAYLSALSIDAKELDALAPTQRSATVRKVVNLVLTREAYLSERHSSDAEAGRRLRSRKTAKLYSGVPAIYAMCEGNPRWFLGITRDLLEHWRASGSRRPVEETVQGDVVLQWSHRFSALLNAVRTPTRPGVAKPPGLLQLLDRIGRYIFDRVVRDEFTDDPCGSFQVDSHTDEATVLLVARALNAGALVFVPGPRDVAILRSLRGRRFRLSYLLAPRFRIPIRLGRPVSLGSILGQAWDREFSPQGQEELGFMSERSDE